LALSCSWHNSTSGNGKIHLNFLSLFAAAIQPYDWNRADAGFFSAHLKREFFFLFRPAPIQIALFGAAHAKNMNMCASWS
jgi:hypothetical protein